MTKSNYSDWNKEELINEIKSLKKQKTYGLVWEEDKTKEDFDYYINWEGGKTKESFGEEDNKFPVLKEIKNKSIDNEDSKYNFMIEGDNYHALAVLNFTHNKSVDVIYIDPPYNTGNKDFIYNDRIVDKEDGFRHSKWLSFMSKRLRLSRYLLSNTGVIFISIDDNEFAQLKILCDDIFGEKNFVTSIIWKRRAGGGFNDTLISINHEYVLVYAKDISKLKFKDKEKDTDKLKKVYRLEDKKGLYKRRDLIRTGFADKREDRPTMYYGIKAPDGKILFPKRSDGSDGRWTFSKESIERMLKEGEAEIIKTSSGWKVYTKERPYKNNGDLKKEKYETVWDDLVLNTHATKEIKEIFEGKDSFTSPKPTLLIKTLVNLFPKSNATVLDFFAGSGTTGHAVMELNKEDGGKRKFILCTNNESNNGTGLKIATDICYPRIKRVIEGYKDSKGNKIEGYKDNFKYFKTDFVDSAPTDQNKKKIVDKSTEMLCIKENAFKLIKEKEGYKIFKNTDIHLGIIFDEDEIDNFIKDAKEIKGKFNVYVFSLDDSIPEKEFRGMKGKVKLCPIPEAILHVYRRIFK